MVVQTYQESLFVPELQLTNSAISLFRSNREKCQRTKNSGNIYPAINHGRLKCVDVARIKVIRALIN